MLRLILYRALNIVEEGEIPSIDMLKTKNQRDHLLTLGLTKKEPEKYSQRTRTTLLNDYRRDVDRLEELTGLDFSAWFV